jgi:hypothetical protein
MSPLGIGLAALGALALLGGGAYVVKRRKASSAPGATFTAGGTAGGAPSGDRFPITRVSGDVTSTLPSYSAGGSLAPPSPTQAPSFRQMLAQPSDPNKAPSLSQSSGSKMLAEPSVQPFSVRGIMSPSPSIGRIRR